jgi:hypothetical protein
MVQQVHLPQRLRAARRLSVAVALVVLGSVFPHFALAVPSFARQTDLPCSQCHTLSFGPALTAYGRQFKLNGYTFGSGEHPLPLAFMVQGGFSRSDVAAPEPAAPHFARNDNLSVDQVSAFLATRLSEHLGMFMQATYSGADRHFSWDNADIRYARTLKLFGTDAVAGISLNNNPTVQDLWNSTPAWAYPYIGSGLAPGPSTSPLISGALAQVALGATAYTMIHDHLYLEAGAYRGLSDHWLGNVGLYPDSNIHMDGAAPYWRAAYQFTRGEQAHYFSFGTFGLSAKLQPDPSVPQTDRYTDFGFDGVYQYTPADGPGSLNINASVIHEKQQLDATFAAGGANNATNHLTSVAADLTYAWQQTYAASVGLFNTTGSTDPTYFGFGTSGTPDTRGYIAMLEWVPFGKKDSWARPWVNVRLGIQYTGYTRFDGGTSNYDGTGRSASDNNTLFLFYWLAF